MAEEYLEMCDELTTIIANEKTLTGNSILKTLKKYASTISVFDMMAFSSQVIEENKYVHENFRKDSEKSYIESFLFRVNNISKDSNSYEQNIDKQSFSNAIATLKANSENETADNKIKLIFHIASLYATFLLEESIHPVGTPFPGSLKVEEKNGQFYCPVRDANIDTPNAVCNICLAKQLDF